MTKVLHQAGPKEHILNVGHGVAQGTPEENVALFCELARQSADIHAAGASATALTDEDLQKLNQLGELEKGLVGC